MRCMDKTRVMDFFGGREATAHAIGCTPQAVSDWPDELPPRIQDRVIAAAVREGKKIPPDMLAANRRAHAA